MDNIERYSLAKFTIGDNSITTDSFKTTIKQEVEEFTSCDSHNPYALSFSGETIEWELTDVDPNMRNFFKDLQKSQQSNPANLPKIATYDYNERTGDLVEDEVFYDAYVSEISKENANDPFSVKGGALRRKQV